MGGVCTSLSDAAAMSMAENGRIVRVSTSTIVGRDKRCSGVGTEEQRQARSVRQEVEAVRRVTLRRERAGKRAKRRSKRDVTPAKKYPQGHRKAERHAKRKRTVVVAAMDRDKRIQSQKAA